jgi:hypothetical protein
MDFMGLMDLAVNGRVGDLLAHDIHHGGAISGFEEKAPVPLGCHMNTAALSRQGPIT